MIYDCKEGYEHLARELDGKNLFEIDVTHGGVIISRNRFAANAIIKHEMLTARSMEVQVDSFMVRLISPEKFDKWDCKIDPYYQLVVWLSSGIEIVFFFWNR